MHGLRESKAEEFAAVQVEEAGGVAQEQAARAIQVANIADPDQVNVVNFQPFDVVGEHKIAPYGGLGDKPAVFDA